ncbi:hypothetical protein BpOF4_20639 (plasmid) [Alkalihalophilus pseudofirmus OF4]|uniref:Uncharacterized protein n=1 Tax=Alkalihalophilus pseudofirmus (strain ATCC BAA-2126 / JCM 17055 / OF4) TaxID=398511 RepID=D3G197_ALKPO|nr:hypothetical protein [Alkalihalophilus pseudofirmus]ADC52123.1 hypothetical protein BpOF4_20639 [Alkalihalophilus pseudofirmus OF4]
MIFLFLLLSLLLVPILVGTLFGVIAIKQDGRKAWYEAGERQIETSNVEEASPEEYDNVAYLLDQEEPFEGATNLNDLNGTFEESYLPQDSDFDIQPSFETSVPDENTSKNLNDLLSQLEAESKPEMTTEPDHSEVQTDPFFKSPPILDMRDQQIITETYGEDILAAITATPSQANGNQTVHVLFGKVDGSSFSFREEKIRLVGNIPLGEALDYLVRGQFISENTFYVTSYLAAEEVMDGSRPISGLYKEEVC